LLDTIRAGLDARDALGASARALSVPTSMHKLPNFTLSVFADVAPSVVGESNATVRFVWCLASGISPLFFSPGRAGRVPFFLRPFFTLPKRRFSCFSFLGVA
jgi:hypothetical protein